MEGKPFWLVWNPLGKHVEHRHDSFESAFVESQRLAKAHPGQEFIVLEAKCGSVINNMMRINYEVPF